MTLKRFVTMSGMVVSMGLAVVVAAEDPARNVVDAPQKAAAVETAEQAEVAQLRREARDQGFNVVDKHGTKYLCRTSAVIGSRLNKKTECYTLEQWKSRTADTQQAFRENTSKQLNKEGG